MIYILLIVMLIFLDQLLKYEIDTRFLEGETLSIVEEFFHLTYVKNRGIAFGLFQGKLDVVSILTFLVIIGLIIYCFKNKKKLSSIEKIAYSFILGGAIGNAIDRIYLGFVIDMIDFRGIWKYIFNLADVWINIGVMLIIFDTFLESKKQKKK